jgi:hypothetical protein
MAAAGSRAGGDEICRDLVADTFACLSGLPAMLPSIGGSRLLRHNRRGRSDICDCDDNIADYIVNNFRPGYDPPQQQTAKQQTKTSARDSHQEETA